MISRYVKFDTSSFGDLEGNIFDDIEEANIDFDSLEIEDNGFTYTTNFKQTGKRKLRQQEQIQSERTLSPMYGEAGLEETSAPEEKGPHRTKRQSRVQRGSSIGQDAHAS